MWESTIPRQAREGNNAPKETNRLPCRRTCAQRRFWLAPFTHLLLPLTLVMVSTATSAWANETIVIKFSHVVAVDTPKGRAAAYFATRAAELTKGQVKVEVYPNSQLYKDKEEMEALQLGSVQMLAPSLSKFSPLGVRAFEVFDLPFIFNGYRELHLVTQGAIGKRLLGKLEAKGIVGLAYWDNGFKVMSANRPMRQLADYKQLRMRIQSSKVLDAQMRALGALPQVLAFSETRQALQSGVVDGTENPPSNLYTQHMHEVQKHVSLTNHGYLGYALVVNKRFWDGLPADIRQALNQAVAESTLVANDSAFKDNQMALEQVRTSKRTQIYQPTPAELAQLRSHLLPVHQQMASRIGTETIEDIYRVTGFRLPNTKLSTNHP
jgi:C4-dicarboxylate-binding protein DctP